MKFILIYVLVAGINQTPSGRIEFDDKKACENAMSNMRKQALGVGDRIEVLACVPKGTR